MITKKNIIKKLHVEVNTNTVAKAMELKDTIDDFIKNEIYPEIEAILKLYNEEIGNNTIQIDTLKLDLEALNYSDIKASIKEKLNKSIQSATSTNTNSHINTFPEDEKTIRALLYFLENGRLPWWQRKLEFVSASDLIKLKEHPRYRDKLVQLLHKKEVQKRLVYQLSFKKIERLVFAASNAIDKSEYTPYKKLVAQFSKPKPREFWRIILSENFTENSTPPEGFIYKEIATVLKLKKVEPHTQNTNHSPTLNDDNLTKDDAHFKDVNEDFAIDTILETEEILIANAGLILLHPFLPQLFTKLDFYKKGEKNLNPNKIHEATQVLHFLATKNESPFEYELTFEKFLCGIPIHTPIDRFLNISEMQKQECDSLLTSVVNHWKALKTNKTDILRSGFLTREGKLINEADSTKIYIQRQAHDILLERIPWGVSLMNLPWLNKIVYITW